MPVEHGVAGAEGAVLGSVDRGLQWKGPGCAQGSTAQAGGRVAEGDRLGRAAAFRVAGGEGCGFVRLPVAGSWFGGHCSVTGESGHGGLSCRWVGEKRTEWMDCADPWSEREVAR